MCGGCLLKICGFAINRLYIFAKEMVAYIGWAAEVKLEEGDSIRSDFGLKCKFVCKSFFLVCNCSTSQLIKPDYWKAANTQYNVCNWHELIHNWVVVGFDWTSAIFIGTRLYTLISHSFAWGIFLMWHVTASVSLIRVKRLHSI